MIKKTTLLAAGALLPFALFAQQPFSIKGEIKSLQPGDKIFLNYIADGKSVLDSAIAAKGTFTFNGKIKDPARGVLYKKSNVKGVKSDALPFYLESGNIEVAATDSLKKATINGSLINRDNSKLKSQSKTVQDQIDILNAEYAKFTPEQKKDKAFIDSFEKRYENISAGLTPIYLDYARNNPDSYISIVVLSQLATNDKVHSDAEQLFQALSPKVRETSTGKSIAGYFEAAKKTKVGLQAIDFTQNDVNDKPVKLSDFKGKYVLVDFWASWCGPCRQENPNVVSAYNQYKDKGFTVLGVSLDQPGKKAAWLKAIEDDKLAWTQVSDLKFWDNAVAKLYGIRSIPSNFLIDPSGKIIAKGLREEALHNKLAEIFDAKSK
ncbi:hypothetical protein TH53_11580 [Pedobacter lusitanus]|uniref:Thioredoxin domain-containing protein n=1 Tax=Pedobacter lusitanus TaxID=1503925 RepID=A0A0D0FWW4_9SPHI|nr:TlpA disulfide reductase family protein [Pedobacter lusitanus]KIO77004.1 hypothetical protein TH53_11580 [Pedobacter lusitanus]